MHIIQRAWRSASRVAAATSGRTTAFRWVGVLVSAEQRESPGHCWPSRNAKVWLLPTRMRLASQHSARPQNSRVTLTTLRRQPLVVSRLPRQVEQFGFQLPCMVPWSYGFRKTPRAPKSLERNFRPRCRSATPCGTSRDRRCSSQHSPQVTSPRYTTPHRIVCTKTFAWRWCPTPSAPFDQQLTLAHGQRGSRDLARRWPAWSTRRASNTSQHRSREMDRCIDCRSTRLGRLSAKRAAQPW